MARRYRNYTPASKVVTRDAETGEVIGVAKSYQPSQQTRIVSDGHKNSDPSLRAKSRREHNSKGV